MEDLTINKALKELNISFKQALDYLEEQGYQIDNSPHAKIDQEIYNVLLHNFKGNNSNINRVIATRGNKSSDAVGYLKPVHLFENEFKTKSLNKQEREEFFVNSGYIVVKYDYSEVYLKFENTEFFSVEFEEDRTFTESYSSSLKYKSLNNGVESVKKLPLIINGTFNEVISEGKIKIPYPHHQFVFIKEQNRIYGPISIRQIDDTEYAYIDAYEKSDYEYNILSLPVTSLGLENSDENVIFCFNEDKIKDYITNNRYGKNDANESYITNLKHLLTNIEPDNYFLNETEEETIEIVNSLIPDISNIKKELWVSPHITDTIVNKKRIERYQNLQKKSENWLNYLNSYISETYLKTEVGKLDIENYIKKNEESIIQNVREEIETNLEAQLTEINDKIEQKNIELEQTNDIILDKQKQLELLKNEAEIKKLKSDELISLENNINKLKSDLKILEDIKDIQKKKDDADEELARVIEMKSSYSKQLEQLRNDYSNESETVMHKKLLELKPYVDALNGFSPKEEINENLTNKNFIIPELVKSSSLEEIIDSAHSYLNSNNRGLKKEDILDSLTNLQQNFLTIYCGLPGIGKTSLVALLSNFLTVDDSFIRIPVARGWNSRKNLLGYYNPIKSAYQYDEFNFIKTLIKTQNTPETLNLPLNVLLDEANLSPLEHYWADFISVYDSPRNKRLINLDNKEISQLTLPSNLRFIGTINTDHTTEILSPRLIDRASFVKLKYSPPASLDNFADEKINPPKNYFSQETLDNIFNPFDAKLNRNESKIIHELIQLLNENIELGKFIPISPRKLKSIIKYCHVTRDLYFDLSGNQVLNLDYAISEHIMPLINGHGSKFEKRLEKLKAFLEEKSLNKSLKELNYIVAAGQDYKNFSYFNQ